MSRRSRVAPPAIRAAHERFKKEIREAYARFAKAKHAAGFCTFGGCMAVAHPDSNRCQAHK